MATRQIQFPPNRLGPTGFNSASAKLAARAILDKALDPTFPGPSGAEIMARAEAYQSTSHAARPRTFGEFRNATFYIRLKIALLLGEASIAAFIVAGILYALYFFRHADTLATAGYLVYSIFGLQFLGVCVFGEVFVFINEMMNFNHHLANGKKKGGDSPRHE